MIKTPLEVLQQIGTFLDYQDYTKWRLSFISNLPSKQLVHFSTGKKYNWDTQQLILDTITPFNYLDFVKLIAQPQHCKLLKYKRFPTKVLLDAFEYLAEQQSQFNDTKKARMMYCIYQTGQIPPSYKSIPIVAFCQAGFTDLVRELLEAGVDPSIYEDKCIRDASLCGHTEIVQLLLQDGRVDPSSHDNDPICSAAYHGHYEIIELLLSHPRVDPSARNNFPIQFAARHQHLSIVKRLLQDPRVDPSANDNYAFKQTFNFESFDVARILLTDKRVDPSCNDQACLKFYVSLGDFDIVEMLLHDERVDPSAENGKVIQLAIDKGFHDIVALLKSCARSRT